MAVITGKDGSVSVGTTNVTQISSWSISIEADTLEYTSFDSGGWKDMMGSLKSWSGSCEGFAGGNDSKLLAVGTEVQLVLVEGTGGTTYTGNAIVTSKSVDASTAELVTVSFDFTGSGEVVES